MLLVATLRRHEKFRFKANNIPKLYLLCTLSLAFKLRKMHQYYSGATFDRAGIVFPIAKDTK